MKRSPIGVLACLLIFLSLAFPAHATTVVPLSLDDLIDLSDVIVHVRVGQVRIVQGDQAPMRVTDLEVLESFHGSQSGEILQLWQRGDGYLIVTGDPWLEPGQEGIAFLRRVQGRIYLTALAQSFWWIDDSGQPMASRNLRGLTFVALGEPRVVPPNRIRWAVLREMVIDACMGVSR